MLYLLKQEGGSNFFYLISGKEYIVGRKNADIIIDNDQSISRQHAKIKVQSNSIKLIDCQSKYGTYYKGIKIEPNIEISVEDQDTIKFGVFQSIYKIEKATIVTTGSGLSHPQKNALKKNLEFLGGTFLNNWDSSCTHLTVEEIVLTIKVLLALIDGKAFVTLEFWDKFVQAVKENQSPPKVEDFRPAVAEVLLDTSAININPNRKILFKGKTFVFPTDKIKLKMESLILKTGGQCLSWERQPLTLSDVTNSKKNYIFIHSDEVKQIPASLKSIFEHLSKLGQRTIPVQEIAMAVMMCSCEKDCNPRFNRVQNVFCKKEADSCSEMFPLAPETQSQDLIQQPKQEMIIPASLDTDLNFEQPIKSLNNREPLSMLKNCASSSKVIPSTSSKRILEENEENPFKKMKLYETSSVKRQEIFVEAKKRKADDNLESPPKKSSLKENPFAVLKNRNNQVGSDNPFTCLRIKQEKGLENNPFAKILEQSKEMNKVGEISMESESAPSVNDTPLSQGYKSGSVNLSEIKWLSRDSKDVKIKVIDIADEFKEIYDKFKNTVVIEVVPLTPRHVNSSGNVNENNTTGGKKNFKKFKKVQPKRPQSSVIHPTISRIAHTESEEVVLLSDGDEDSDNALPLPTPKRINQSRRFNF